MDLGGQGQGGRRVWGIAAAAALAATVAAWLLLIPFSTAGGDIGCSSAFADVFLSEDPAPPPDATPEDACRTESAIRLFLAMALALAALVGSVVAWRFRYLGQLDDVAREPSPVVRPRPFYRWGSVLGLMAGLPSLLADPLAAVLWLPPTALSTVGLWRMVVVVRDGALYRRGPLRWYPQPLFVDSLVVDEISWGSVMNDLHWSWLTRRFELADLAGTEMVFDAFLWNPAQLRAALTVGDGRVNARV